jgi:hypothetical protein
MFANRTLLGLGVAALGAVSLALAPASAATPKRAKKSGFGSLGSFTPSSANPRLAAAMARGGGLSSREFRFTPSATNSRRAVTVAIRTQANTKAEAERIASIGTISTFTPSAYNLGVSIGWKQFALSGDVGRVRGNLLPGDRETVGVGLSYGLNRWRTRLGVAADRATGSEIGLVGGDQSYSVDLGGSYALTGNLELNGGVRYRAERDRLMPFADERHDAQAVYVGTAFRF